MEKTPNESYEDILKIAETTKKKEDYLRAWVLSPWQIEPLVKVANQLLDERKHKEACVIAQLGVTLPIFNDSVNEKWQFELRKILSIGSYYTSNHKEGLKQAEFLHFSRQSPYRFSLAHNNIYYAKKLNLVSKFELKIDSEVYHPMNTSLYKNEDKIYACVRTVNYTVDKTGKFSFDGPAIKTNNYLLTYTDKFVLCDKQIKLQDGGSQTKVSCKGIEDIRLYQVTNDTIFGYGDRWDCGTKSAAIYKLQWDKTGQLLKQNPLSDGTKCEKNWLPFIDQGLLKHVYSHSPFIIVSPDNNSILINQEQELDLSHFRGGASPIWFKDRWLWIIHETVMIPGKTKRSYYHRWVWSDKEFKKIEFSKPFIIEHFQYEFIMGLVQIGNDLLISYGIEDREAWLGIVTENEVEKYINNRD